MYESRLQRLAAALPQDADAAIITSDISRRYLTGMHSSAGIVVVSRRSALLIIDSRYIEVARATTTGLEVILQEKLTEQLPKLLKKYGIHSVCFEEDYMTLSRLISYKAMLPDITVIENGGVSQTIDLMRRIKSPQELGFIMKAQEIADRGFAEILNFIKPGKTEKEVALELEFMTRKMGSEGPSFDFIVISGKNTSKPHGRPTDKPIESGDMITMDYGCIVEGYHSDMTRTIAVGSITEEQRQVYELVLGAQEAALNFAAAGKTGAKIDAAARDVISAEGFGAQFSHGLGHGVGLEVHEMPRFSPYSTETIEAGNVISVEPGIYLEGKFGCRIEDVIYIGENENINLCKSPKELIIL